MGAIITWIRGGNTRVEMKTVDLKPIENVSILNFLFNYDPENTTWEHEEREFLKKNPYYVDQLSKGKGNQKRLQKKDLEQKKKAKTQGGGGGGVSHHQENKHESTKEKKKKTELKAHEENLKNKKHEKQLLEEQLQQLLLEIEDKKKDYQMYLEMLKEQEQIYNECMDYEFQFNKIDHLKPINLTEPKTLQKTAKIN